MITTSLVNFCQHMQLQWASQVALVIKNPPADAGDRQGIWVQPMGRENTLGRAQQSTPVVLLGESHGQRSLVDYHPQDHKESDMTEATQCACTHAHRQLQFFPPLGTFQIYSPSNFQLQNTVLITVTILYIKNVSIISFLLHSWFQIYPSIHH